MIETLELFAIAGITLEIFGFILILKFDRIVTDTIWLFWMQANMKKVQTLEERGETQAKEVLQRSWDDRRKAGIFFVIFGLFFQILELLID